MIGKVSREFSEIIQYNRHLILDSLFSVNTPLQVELSVSFARYLNSLGLNKHNYLLFLKIIETNNKWVVDTLLAKRNPRLLFSVIKPNSYLIRRAFQLMSSWHPGQIHPKVLLAVLGIIENAYYSPDDGYRIYKLEINDLNSLGKFLDESKDQFEDVNTTLLDILDKITRLGEYRSSLNKSVLSKHAFHIRLAYFDNKKSLVHIIPQVLLSKLKREDTEIVPQKDFLSYIQKIDNN